MIYNSKVELKFPVGYSEVGNHVGKTKAKNNLVIKNNPGFVDFEKGNYNLKKDSEIFKKIPGFINIPFDEIGLKSKKQ